MGLHEPSPSWFSPISLSSRWVEGTLCGPLPSNPSQPSSPEAPFFQQFLRSVKNTGMSLVQKKVDALYHQTCDDVYGMVRLHFQRHQKLEKVAGFKLKQLSKGKSSPRLAPKSKCEAPFCLGVQRLYGMQSAHWKSNVCGLQCTQQWQQNIAKHCHIVAISSRTPLYCTGVSAYCHGTWEQLRGGTKTGPSHALFCRKKRTCWSTDKHGNLGSWHTHWHFPSWFLIPDCQPIMPGHVASSGTSLCPGDLGVAKLPSLTPWWLRWLRWLRPVWKLEQVVGLFRLNLLIWEARQYKAESQEPHSSSQRLQHTRHSHPVLCPVEAMRANTSPYSRTRHQSKLKVMAVAEQAEDHYTTILYTMHGNTSRYSQHKIRTERCRMAPQYLRLQSLSGASQERSTIEKWSHVRVMYHKGQMKQKRTKQTTCNHIRQSMTSRFGLLFFISSYTSIYFISRFFGFS